MSDPISQSTAETTKADDDLFIVIDYIGGNCPVQAEGTINGKPFYFRARGEHWRLGIGGADPCGSAEWEHIEWFGSWPAAGWMEVEQAEAFLRSAAKRYAEGMPGARLEDDDAVDGEGGKIV